ncbi:MAG: hypothetical protein E6R13_03130 [Spirochaetes bacterium]|nr:MAG: hypothetical protein E6R13_03130 [Spirochaetota bacterium]
MTRSLLSYFGWALLQHCVVLLLTWFWNIEIVTRVALAISAFTLAHYPNKKLMYITAVAGTLFYTVFGLLFYLYGTVSLISFIPMCFIHAYVGRKLIQSGMEMRVLWLYPTNE